MQRIPRLTYDLFCGVIVFLLRRDSDLSQTPRYIHVAKATETYNNKIKFLFKWPYMKLRDYIHCKHVDSQNFLRDYIASLYLTQNCSKSVILLTRKNHYGYFLHHTECLNFKGLKKTLKTWHKPTTWMDYVKLCSHYICTGTKF